MIDLKRKHKILYRAAAFILVLAFCLTGCGKEGANGGDGGLEAVTDENGMVCEPANLAVSGTSKMGDPSDVILTRNGMVINPLTGEWIDKKYINKRPISVMIENTGTSIPQYGMSHADIIYEMYSEAGVSRLMGIFTEWDEVEKFEPMRSDLHYFDRKAVEYDAVHVFCGASDYANDNDLYGAQYPYLEFIDMIRDPGLQRDSTRYAPHNAFTVPESIQAQIEAKGFNMNHRSYYTPSHQFNSEFMEIEGQVAEKVTVPFGNNMPWFEYDEDYEVYYRYQFGNNHRDGETGYTLYVMNILIQLVSYTDLPGYETSGALDVDWSGSGEGFYCTAGKMVPVTWKYSHNSTRWYDQNGRELKMNPGKTWICVYDKSDKDGVLFEKLEEPEEETEE